MVPLWLAGLGLTQQGSSALPHSGSGGSKPGNTWVRGGAEGWSGHSVWRGLVRQALGRGISAWLEAAPAKLDGISYAQGQPLLSHHRGHGPDGAGLQAPGLD